MNETRGLWRGKTTPKCNDEEFNSIWVDGDLIHSEKLCYIHPFANAVKVQGELGRLIVMHKVDPSTLGRCTGLRDKNGKLIFEGDIVEYDNVNYEIEYIEGFAAFSLRSVDNMSYAPRITTNTVPHMGVIGNIHDNPEYL